MKKAIIKNSNNVITHFCEKETSELLNQWIENVSASGAFGENYQIEYSDTTEQKELERQSEEALNYLQATDYLVVRKAETGQDYAQEIKDARAAARLKVL